MRAIRVTSPIDSSIGSMVPVGEANPVVLTLQAGGSEQGSGLQITVDWNSKSPKIKVKMILVGDKLSKNIRKNIQKELNKNKIRIKNKVKK